MAEVRLTDVTKRYGSVVAVDGLTLRIPDRAFVTLLGPSGCGKTTSLRLIAGLEPVTEGAIAFDGDPVTHLPADRRDIAMVFQSYALYPHMSVAQNMGFALRMMKVDATEIERRVREAAGTLGITELLERRPWQLSGGQRQRVALGRAIVREPAVFLMDEPLSNLDVTLRVSMRSELKRLHQELGRTFVYVTHDQAEALALSDLVAVMDHGRLQQVGSPDGVYERPANVFVATFVGSPAMNLMQGRLGTVDGAACFDGASGRLPLVGIPPSRDRPVVLGVRPEDLQLGNGGGAGDAWTGTVNIREPNGADVFLTVRVSGYDVVARTDRSASAEPGSSVSLKVHPERFHLFDADTGDRIDAGGTERP